MGRVPDSQNCVQILGTSHHGLHVSGCHPVHLQAPQLQLQLQLQLLVVGGRGPAAAVLLLRLALI
jgi:hypothetical protein